MACPEPLAPQASRVPAGFGSIARRCRLRVGSCCCSTMGVCGGLREVDFGCF